MQNNELLEQRIEEALIKLERLRLGSDERKLLVEEIETLQQLQTANYRAEVEAYDKQEKLELEKEELGLKEAEVENGKRRTVVELVKIGVMATINVLMINRVLKVEEEGTVRGKAYTFLPKGRFW